MASRRRGHNEGSIYRRKDGRWAAAITLPGGRRKYLYARSRQEAVRKLHEALRAQEEGMPLERGRATVGSWLQRWLEEVARPRLCPSTYRSYSDIVRLHLVPSLGGLRLSRLTPMDVQALLNRKLEAGLSPRRVQYVHAVLRASLEDAMRFGLVARNVAWLVSPPRAERPPVRPLGLQEARALVQAARGHRLGALFVLALATGLRLGELLGLRWEDVDLEGGTVTVCRTLQRVGGELVWGEPKSARSRRTVPVPAPALEALREHRRRQLEERLALGEAWADPGLVFATSIGTPLDPRGVGRLLGRLLERAGVRQARFHDLRHTAASFLLALGVHPRVAMETLGHSQVSLTMDTYSHVTAALQREAAERLGELLEG